MIYCGMTMNEYHSNNRTKDFTFSDPYSALCEANKKWEDDINHDDIARLLIVFRKEDGIEIDDNVAFFQFKSRESVKNFIANQQEIIWSQEGNEIWNGDAIFMNH